MKIEQFEKELQKLDPDFSIRPSRFEGLSGVYIKGNYMFAVPSGNIYPEPIESYGVETVTGKFQRHRTIDEALVIAKSELHNYKTDDDYRDAMLGEGKYSKQALS